MQNEDSQQNVDMQAHPNAATTRHRPIDWLMSIGACVAIFAVAGFLLHLIFANEPEATREGATQKTPMLVRVHTVDIGDYRPQIIAMGTVIPAQAIALSPRVSGEVINRAPSFLPGGLVKAGETLIKLDPADYTIAVSRLRSALSQRQGALSQAEAAVKQATATKHRSQAAVNEAKAAVSQAEAALALERGRQNVAKEDFALLNETLAEANKALVLRQPQLQSALAQLAAAKAEMDAAEAEAEAATAQIDAARADVEATKADVKAAQAALQQAELDLKRTSIAAPFDALVLSRNVSVGSQASTGSQLGQLVAIDSYWVEATVPLAVLARLEFPDDNGDTGTTVRIRNRVWPEGAHRTGKLLRPIGTLDRQTRLARILIEVVKPLATSENAPALILDSFVEARIPTALQKGVIRISRNYLRDNDIVWVMTDGKLDIRPVNVLFQDDEFAYIRAAASPDDGLCNGDHVVITQLSSVVPGAALRLNSGDGIVKPTAGAPE